VTEAFPERGGRTSEGVEGARWKEGKKDKKLLQLHLPLEHVALV